MWWGHQTNDMGSTRLGLILIAAMLVWNVATANSGGCGNIQGHKSGALYSPGHPNNYPTNQACDWEIRVDDGYQIELSFVGPFVLEPSATCDYDYIQLAEMDPVTGQQVELRQHCGDDNPGTYTSTTSWMKLRFRSDGSNEYAGFSLYWRQIGDGNEDQEAKEEGNEEKEDLSCNYKMEGDKGTISYLYTEYENQANRKCTWNISVPAGKTIFLEFDNSTFDIGGHDHKNSDCDILQVYDVMGNSSLVSRGSWCEKDKPQAITSFGSQLHIVLNGNGDGVTKNFSANWHSVSECGGMLTAPEGYIMSYNYPESNDTTVMDSLQTCSWNIVTSKYHHVILNIHDLGDCYNLEIFDYPERDQYFTLHHNWFCGAHLTAQNMTSLHQVRLRSSSSKMLLLYQNRGNSGRGFYASWTTGCGEILSARKGNFSSPAYGIEYPPSQDCEWEISGGREDQGLRLDFQSLFDIETSNDGSCHYDYVEILVSKPGGATLETKGRFCGTKPPPRFITTADKVVIRFHSDRFKQGKGFAVAWDTNCGDVYNALEGNITSPRFPSRYPNSMNCSWEIVVPDGYTVQLTFGPAFSLEGNSRCEADYVELFDYTLEGKLSRKGRWCGDKMPPFQTSQASRMLLVFHSDVSKNYNGFQAHWTSGKYCGKEFNSPNGTFASPGFPQSYPDNMNCRWEIHATQGQWLKLEFGSNIDLEMDKDDCSYDGVEVMEKLSNGTILSYGKWCSVRKIPVFYSTSSLVILFYSDTSKSGKGFSASWQLVQGCDETLTRSTGHLMSSNYPSNYLEYERCRWDISPKEAANITLHFDSLFDLESDSTCAYDYVEIYRGQNLLGRWCGSTSPPDIVSDGEPLVVIFVSDKSATGKGFFASWD